MNLKTLFNSCQNAIARCMTWVKLKPAGRITLISAAIAVLILGAYPLKAQSTPSGPFGTGSTINQSSQTISLTRRAGPTYYAYALGASQTDGARNCGSSRQITSGWRIDDEVAFKRGTTALNTPVNTSGGYFSGGTFLAPYTGMYHVCMSARAETGAVDVTLRKNGQRIAAIGTDLIQRLNGNSQNFGGYWSSHSICRNVYLSQNAQLTMWMESGASTDCTLETSFVYNTLDINLLFADED